MAAAGPTFLGIGAQKAGTTWLHQMFKLHPGIGLPEKKELHYWDVKHAQGMPLDEYAALFAGLHQQVRGEITPAYAILAPETIGIVKSRYPELRLLLTLRNPLERAWSNAKMYLVLQKIVTDETGVDRIGDDWYLDHFRSDLSLRRGDYETCLRNWLLHFDRSQLSLSLYDDLLGDPRVFLERSSAHIGADPGFYSRLDGSILAQRIGTTAHSRIRASLLPTLRDIYADRIKSLSDYLGMDLTIRWIEPYR